jgi:hypothetical protein
VAADCGLNSRFRGLEIADAEPHLHRRRRQPQAAGRQGAPRRDRPRRPGAAFERTGPLSGSGTSPRDLTLSPSRPGRASSIFPTERWREPKADAGGGLALGQDRIGAGREGRRGCLVAE